MKKSLKFILSIAVMLIALVTVTSCEPETKTSVVVDASIAVRFSQSTSAEKEAIIKQSYDIINTRIDEMFGKYFDLECDDEGVPTQKAFDKICNRIDKDKTIQTELKTLEDMPEVTDLAFLFYSGTTEVAYYNIKGTYYKR